MYKSPEKESWEYKWYKDIDAVIKTREYLCPSTKSYFSLGSSSNYTKTAEIKAEGMESKKFPKSEVDNSKGQQGYRYEESCKTNITTPDQKKKEYAINSEKHQFSASLHYLTKISSFVSPSKSNKEESPLLIKNTQKAEQIKGMAATKSPNLKAKPEQKIYLEGLPKTGYNCPFERIPPQFLQTEQFRLEPIGICLSQPVIQDLKRNIAERVLGSSYGLGMHRLIYDSYETSRFNTNNLSDDQLASNSDCTPIEPSPSSYNQICIGKGAPCKIYNKKPRYVDALLPYYKLQGSSDSTLIFESRFESGNLRRAVQV